MDTYKQKYEQALSQAKKELQACGSTDCDAYRQIIRLFPELKESEDERIRRDIIRYLKKTSPAIGENIEKMLAWLEKQGEKIDAIENLDTEFEKQVSHLIASAINKEHEYNQSYVKWTANALLNYAKHELEKQGEQSKQHLYDIIIALWNLLDKIDTFSDLQIDDTNPDNPFKKIEYIAQERHKFVKSDGYNLYIKGEQITDFKQDEQKPTDKVEPKFKVGDTIVEKDLDEYDYETIKDIKDGQYIFTDGYCMNIDEQEGWQLVKTPVIVEQKPAWSEVDKLKMDTLIHLIDNQKGSAIFEGLLPEELVSWLKSLKEKYAWKPSEEQMKALNYVINLMASSESPTENDYYYNVFKDLRTHLKKLRKE